MVYTGLSTEVGATKLRWWRRKKAEEIQRRAPQQHEMDFASRLEAIETELAKVQYQFRQLRGYVYVRKGLVGADGEAPPGEVELPPKSAPTPPATATMSKAELRAHLHSTGRLNARFHQPE